MGATGGTCRRDARSAKTEIVLGQLEEQFADELASRSGAWRLISFAMWGAPGYPAFASVWAEDERHPAQELYLTISEQDVEVHRAEALLAGLTPTMIAATGAGSEASFSLLVEDIAPMPQMSAIYTQLDPGVPEDSPLNQGSSPAISVLQATQQSPSSIVGVMTSLSAYERGGKTHLATTVLAHPTTGYLPWGYSVSTGDNGPLAFESSTRHQVMRSGWARPDVCAPWPDLSPSSGAYWDRHPMSTLWRGDTFRPWPADMTAAFDMGAIVRGPMPAAAVLAEVATMAALGYQPWSVGAAGPYGTAPFGSGTERIAVVFVPKGRTRPLPRANVVVDARDEVVAERVGPWTIDASAGFRLKQIVTVLPATGAPGGAQSSSLASALGGGLTKPKAAALDLVEAVRHRYDALDEILFGLLAANGARGLQLAASKNGVLRCVRSCTRAEQGYPVLDTFKLLGIGSVAKWLVSMAVIGHFAPNGLASDLDIPLTEALAQASQAPFPVSASDAAYLPWLTLNGCLFHRTGLRGEPGEDEVFEVLGKAVREGQPGDFVGFLQEYGGQLFKVAPVPEDQQPHHFPFEYAGFSRRLMSELVSLTRTAGQQSGDYERQMREWWGNLVPHVAHAHVSDRNGALAANEFPLHARLPYTSWKYVQNALHWAPAQYSGNARWSLGPGGWMMSAATLVRIFSAMVPLSAAAPNGVPILTPDQVELFYSQNPPGEGRGCGLQALTSTSGKTFRHLWHNGGADGCAAFASVYIERPTVPDTPPVGQGLVHPPVFGQMNPVAGAGLSTWAVAYLINQDVWAGLDTATMDLVFQAILDIDEGLAGLPEDDLFGVY